MSYDDHLLSIGRKVPGFGGFYPDSAGITVWMTGSADNPEIPDLLRSGVDAVVQEAKRVRANTFISHAIQAIRIRQGVYSFEQLYSWKAALYATELPDGTVYVGINKRENRLAVGVVDVANREAWERKSLDAGIPIEAVTFEILPAMPLATDYLKLKVRPTKGGVQLGSPNTCTMTTNVTYRLDPLNKHFVTASHCSLSMWSIDAVIPGFSEWRQPGVPDVIGLVEAADPPGFTGSPCPAGKVCRYTDATVVRLSDVSAWQFATVARATAPAPFAIAEVFSLVEQPFVMWEFPSIFKTGRTTGTTYNPDVYGGQTQYCYDWPYSANVVVLCQIKYPGSFTALGGDSGAPVYGRYSSIYQPAGTAFLVGIVVGGGAGFSTVVSPADMMTYDFGYDQAGGYVVYYTCVGVGIC